MSTLLQRNAALYSNRIALECEGRLVTHAELLRRAARAGNAFMTAGARRGDRVVVIARNSIEMVEVLCACELFGFIAVPVNHRLADAELITIVKDCAPSILVADDEFASTAAVLTGSLESECVSAALGASGSGVPSLDDICNDASEALPGAHPAPRDPAYIIYTSGSTGRPKGVVLSHGGMVEAGRLLASPAGLRPDSVQIVVMPLFHVGATAQRMGYLVHGGKMVLHRRFDAGQIVLEIGAGEITDLHLAPTMLRSVLDAMDGAEIRLGALESLKYASSPIPDGTLSRALQVFGPKLLQYYALTEAGGIGSVLHKYVHAEAMTGHGVGRLRSAGQVHLGCDIQIRRGDGTVCKAGEEGEIWIRSESVMSEYWGNPKLTGENLIEGWLRSGDVGRFDDEQFLFIMDRVKDMIVSGGENIYSSEVERALESHPSVLEAAVIGIPDDRWGEAVHAFIVLRPGMANPSASVLIDFCKERIASYKKPSSVQFVESLPRLQHVQKIDKQSLRKPFWNSQRRAVN